MLGKAKMGTCETCGKSNRSLRRLDSGQWVCHTCLREIRPARAKGDVPLATIRRLQAAGFHVDDYAANDEVRRLKAIENLRHQGVHLPESATTDQINAALSSISREWYDKIAGVSRTQRLVRGLDPGDQLFPVRDPRNRYDANAIKLLNEDGDQVGWIRAEANGSMAHDMDKGVYHEVFVKAITGHYQRLLGVNIRIVKYPNRRIRPGVATPEMPAAMRRASATVGTVPTKSSLGLGYFAGRAVRHLVDYAKSLFG